MLRLHVTEGTVIKKEAVEKGLFRLRVDCDQRVRTALAYHPPLPKPCLGDRVVLHTAAVDLNLGTGGYDFVMHIVGKGPSPVAGDGSKGHMVKMRYTPWQIVCLAVEEEASPHHEAMQRARDVDGMPAVVLGLHSQLPPAAAALREMLGTDARIVFLMTSDGALPLVFSETVRRLRAAGLLDAVVTAGDAFGGDLEAMTVYSGLLAARHVLKADVVVVGPGPGMPGTGTPFGTTGIHVGQHADAVEILQGRAVVAPRMSFADKRRRHQGISHHTLTALGIVAQKRCTMVLPTLPSEQRKLVEAQLQATQISSRHGIVTESRGRDVLRKLDEMDIPLRSMGRDDSSETALFLAAAAAGYVAADMIETEHGRHTQ